MSTEANVSFRRLVGQCALRKELIGAQLEGVKQGDLTEQRDTEANSDISHPHVDLDSETMYIHIYIHIADNDPQISISV